MKIKDLIGTPNFKIDTTVNIVLFKNMEKSRQQIRRTVLTPSFKSIIEISLDSIIEQTLNLNPPDSQCFLIEGIFGSGKSHLLSFLFSLFDGSTNNSIRNSLWNKIEEKFNKNYLNLKEKNFLVIPIALHERRQEDLIDIIFREIEKQIYEKLNVKIDLSSPSKYVTYYNTECLPGIKAEINKNIPNLEDFNKLDENDDFDLYRKAMLIRQSMEFCNIQMKDGYKIGDDLKKSVEIILDQSFEKTEKQIQAEFNFDGIILLIDEFSEYLKSKKKTETDEEGHKRTLASIQIQYLAEFIKGKDIFLFIAAQEAFQSLDPLFEKQAQTGGRLKTLQLEYHHFVEIFNELIIPEKINYEREIKSLFPTLKTNFFNNHNYIIHESDKSELITTDIFFDCYPFHPKTVELLMTTVFKYATKTRAGLSYAQEYIKKSSDLDQNSIITPDSLFDYFKMTFKTSEPNKFKFVEKLRNRLKAFSDLDLSQNEILLLLKIFKLIFISPNPITAEDCISNLFIGNKTINQIEILLEKFYNISRKTCQPNYLRREFDLESRHYRYYIQLRGDLDVEDLILVLSQKITEQNLYNYYLSKFWDVLPNTNYLYEIEVLFNNWQISRFHVKYDNFNDVLSQVTKIIESTPKWTPKDIDFIELFTFCNFPFKDEYDRFSIDKIVENLKENFYRTKELRDRIVFFLFKPLNEVLISDIKRSLAFDLINKKFTSMKLDSILKTIIATNNEISDDINKFYNDFSENEDEILSQLARLANQYSFQKSLPLYAKIKGFLLNNFKLIGINGEIPTLEKDIVKILTDKLEVNIPKYYPNFPEFDAKIDETRYINIILNELFKDQNTFKITSDDAKKLKGKVIIGIGEKLGVFNRKVDDNYRTITFKIGIPPSNLFYRNIMEIIPKESTKGKEVSLSNLCEHLRKEYGLNLNLCRILLACLLHQDNIKIVKKKTSKVYDNSHVKHIFVDNIRDFPNFLVFQPNKLEPNDILWIFSLYNPLNKQNQTYNEKFQQELTNIEFVEEIKSAKQKLLVDLMRNFDINEYKEVKTVLNLFLKEIRAN